MTILKSVLRSTGRPVEMNCKQTQKLMSPFIDSMATPDEAERVETHLSACEPCQRQLQSYISVKNLLFNVEEPAMPTDLVLETRVRLSHERNSDGLWRLGTRLANSLKPIALPALLGTCFTFLLFGMLLSNLIAPPVIASNEVSNTPIALYQRVRTTDPTLTRFADNGSSLSGPLTVDILVSGRGRMIDYTILSGPGDPGVDRWLRELLYYAEFTPANLFGRPVNSRIIVSFIGVTS
jgi:hypothetical protein